MSATTWFIISIVGFSLSGIALVAAIFLFIKLRIPAVIGDLNGKTVVREVQAMRMDKKSAGVVHATPTASKTASVQAVDSAAMAAAHASKRLDRSPVTGGGASDLPKAETTPQNSTAPSEARTTETLSNTIGEIDIDERRNAATAVRRETVVLSETKQTDVLSQAKQTDVLSEERKPGVLSQARQTDILSEERKTDILSKGKQTEVLSEVHPTKSSVTAAKVPARGDTVLLQGDEELSEAPMPVQPVTFRVTRSETRIHTDEVI